MKYIPSLHTNFLNEVYAFGNPSDDALTKQAILSALNFLFQVLNNTQSSQCPHYNNLTLCSVQRTIECKQFPWGRGDVGGKLCTQGMLGKILKIDQACIVKIN